MGMFDYVNAPEIRCPECGEPVTGWQSKDGPCELLTLEYYEVSEFYADCKHCGVWVRVERRVPPPPPPIVPISDYDVSTGRV